MAALTGRELIYQTILNGGTQHFRNRDVAEVTGMERQRVAECLKILMNEGILAKQGVYYYVVDQQSFVRFMLERQGHNVHTAEPSKLLVIDPEAFENLLGSLLVVNNVPGADDWRSTGLLIKHELREEIDTAISTLQAYKKRLATEDNSGPYSNRVARDGNYAARIQTNFINAAELFAGTKLTGELITEYVRPRLREFFRLDEPSILDQEVS